MLFIAKVIIAYFVFINVITFLAFYFDKKAAIANARRISERMLLSLAFIGGSPLAIVAMQKFRHKTVKQPFLTMLIAIIVIQVILIIGMLYYLSKTFDGF